MHCFCCMSKEPTRPDLIARYEALDYPNRLQFESKHGLPANMIGKMKYGAYFTAASNDSIARLEAAIQAEEIAKPTGKWADPLPESPPVTPVRQGRPPVRTTLSDDDKKTLDDLAEALETAKDIKEVDACNKLTTGALLRGVITDAQARVIKELIAERRQSLHAQRELEEKAKAGRELTIRVVFVRDWTGGPLPGDGPA